ncbi:hypothetical protein ACFLXY_04900 [Chloroflexota bacterium]
MKEYYISIEDELKYERSVYAEELHRSDWLFFEENAETFLIHAYRHLLDEPSYENYILGSYEERTQYNQFYLNLAIGLELLLKSILLKKSVNVNLKNYRTLQFGNIISEYMEKILPKLSLSTIDEIKTTLMLINEKRNNIAHRSKRSYEHYANEYRFSYVTLYIYERYFFKKNDLLTELLLKSISRAKVSSGADYSPLKIKPKSMR